MPLKFRADRCPPLLRSLVERMCSYDSADRPSLETVVDELSARLNELGVEEGPRGVDSVDDADKKPVTALPVRR